MGAVKSAAVVDFSGGSGRLEAKFGGVWGRTKLSPRNNEDKPHFDPDFWP